MTTPVPPPPESLLGELPQLLRLVRDAHLADDLVQETVVRALERPRRNAPEHEGKQEGWLATVLRHLAIQTRRSRARRESREHAAARPEASDAAREAAARFDLHRELV